MQNDQLHTKTFSVPKDLLHILFPRNYAPVKVAESTCMYIDENHPESDNFTSVVKITGPNSELVETAAKGKDLKREFLYIPELIMHNVMGEGYRNLQAIGQRCCVKHILFIRDPNRYSQLGIEYKPNSIALEIVGTTANVELAKKALKIQIQMATEIRELEAKAEDLGWKPATFLPISVKRKPLAGAAKPNRNAPSSYASIVSTSSARSSKMKNEDHSCDSFFSSVDQEFFDSINESGYEIAESSSDESLSKYELIEA